MIRCLILEERELQPQHNGRWWFKDWCADITVVSSCSTRSRRGPLRALATGAPTQKGPHCTLGTYNYRLPTYLQSPLFFFIFLCPSIVKHHPRRGPCPRTFAVVTTLLQAPSFQNNFFQFSFLFLVNKLNLKNSTCVFYRF